VTSYSSFFANYGKVNLFQLRADKDDVKQLKYDTHVPIDAIYDSIEDLQELAELSCDPYTSSQIVNLGFVIMNSFRMLLSDVRKWLRKPAMKKHGQNSSSISPKPTPI